MLGAVVCGMEGLDTRIFIRLGSLDIEAYDGRLPGLPVGTVACRQAPGVDHNSGHGLDPGLGHS